MGFEKPPIKIQIAKKGGGLGRFLPPFQSCNFCIFMMNNGIKISLFSHVFLVHTGIMILLVLVAVKVQRRDLPPMLQFLSFLGPSQ